MLAHSGVTLRATGCKIFGSFSTAPFWKSKFTGFGPGDDKLLVGLSTNFVHSFTVSLVCGDKIGSVSGLTEWGVSFPGASCGGRVSGSSNKTQLLLPSLYIYLNTLGRVSNPQIGNLHWKPTFITCVQTFRN